MEYLENNPEHFINELPKRKEDPAWQFLEELRNKAK